MPTSASTSAGASLQRDRAHGLIIYQHMHQRLALRSEPQTTEVARAMSVIIRLSGATHGQIQSDPEGTKQQDQQRCQPGASSAPWRTAAAPSH